MFVGLHVLLAERMDAPELAITEQEGKDFMTSVQNVMRHYSVETTQKTLDWVALMGTASGIYVPRIAAVSMRRKMSKQPQPQRKPTKQSEQSNGVVSIVPDQFGGGFTGEAS